MASKLLAFLKANKDNGQGIRSEVVDDSTNIYIDDVISDFWGISAKDFTKELLNVETKNVALHINSPGGDVFEARAIQSAIAQSDKTVIAYIDSLAASAATFIALACDEVHMSDGAFFMIHNAWSVVAGNANEIEKEVSILRKIDDSLCKDYTRKTGKEDSIVKEWMDSETWFTADEALENGFVDKILPGSKIENNAWDFTGFENVPQALTKLQAPPKEKMAQVPVAKTEPIILNTPNEQEHSMTIDVEALNVKMADLEDQLNASKENEKKAEAKMAEYEASVATMAKATMTKDVTTALGTVDAEFVMSFYGKLSSEDMNALTDKIKTLTEQIDTLGASTGTPIVDEQKTEHAYADVQKYATEHNVSFMEANRIMHTA